MLAPHSLQPGSRLGRYELVRFLGEGGFAEVWLGQRSEDPSAGPVAIKVVRRGRFGSALHRTMFLDEANIAARVRHPNVASVFEAAEEDGMPYLVMEYVSGGSLETVVRGIQALNEPLPVAVAVHLASDVCAALHAAHEITIDGRPLRVVHRDVSPQNVLLTEAGVPKLIDFGIAKACERMTRRTSTGVAKGKVGYMSPEQARGEAIDRRADVWAVGALLYELLEGRRLLEGPSEIACLQALVARPLRPVFARTPERLAAVLRKASSFRARDRHATAEELRLELAQALSLEGLRATAEEVAVFCRRARAAGELATLNESVRAAEGTPRPEPAGDVTILSLAPSGAGPRRRRTWAWLGGAMALAAVAAVGAARTAHPSPPRVDAVHPLPPPVVPPAVALPPPLALPEPASAAGDPLPPARPSLDAPAASELATTPRAVDPSPMGGAGRVPVQGAAPAPSPGGAAVRAVKAPAAPPKARPASTDDDRID